MDSATPPPPSCEKQTVLTPPSSEKQIVPASPSSETQVVPAATAKPSTKQTAAKPPATSRPPRLLATDLFPGMAEEARQTADAMLGSSDLLRKFAAPMCLEATCGPDWKCLGVAPFVGQHDQILRDSGRPTDPVEIMLLEQIQVAFHHSLELQQRMMTSDSREAVKIYNSAACRMQAEFRRMALALQAYRGPRQRGQFVVVKQQNLASGNQQIALIDGTRPPSSPMKLPENAPNTELGSSKPTALSYQPAEAPFPEPKASSCRQEELAAARPVDGRSPRKTPRRHAKKQAVEVLDGPENA